MKELKYAGFVPKSLEDALQKNAACQAEPVERHMNTEHVDLGSDFSDAAVAETFLHHRILVLPITEDGRVVGVVTRGDFVRELAQRLSELG
jgi:CBS domain-containing protein